jgi:hypothetical protein
MSTIPLRAELLAVIGLPCPYCGQTVHGAGSVAANANTVALPN